MIKKFLYLLKFFLLLLCSKIRIKIERFLNNLSKFKFGGQNLRLDSDALNELIREIAGKEVVPLVDLLKDKINISEFVLADKLKITVNQVRNMLYRLYSYNLVSFIRKKDKKKGWYIYYWTFNNLKAKDEIIKLKKRKIENLKKLLEREKEGNFFICPDKCIRLKFDDALNYIFKCPECSKVLEHEDNTKNIERIKKEIEEIEGSLEKEIVLKEPIKKLKEKVKKHKKIKKKVKKKFKKKTISKKAKKKKIKKKSKKKVKKKSISKKNLKKKIKKSKKSRTK